MKLFLVLVIAIIYNLESSNACTCIRPDPELHYCVAEFVAVIKIGARHEDTEKRVVYYEFEVKQVLRATEKGNKSLASNRLITSGPCGIFSALTEGQELVITGGVDNDGYAHVGLCNYHDVWSNVKPEIKAGFLGGYKCSST
jgi:hypothetical protein